MAAQDLAMRSAGRAAHKVTLSKKAWSGPEFFASHSEGERVVVELNTRHPITEQIMSTDPRNRQEPTGRVLSAVHRTVIDLDHWHA